VICSDKTGTLTLNQMTARAIVVDDVRLAVSGEGYGRDGAITSAAGAQVDRSSVGDLLDAAVLCNDSRIDAGTLIGDPTEGALVALAAKADVDADVRRRQLPRVAEIPFDSARKYMATFHRDGDQVVLLVKGATDVLLERCALTAGRAEQVVDELEALAGDGLRVLALARRELPGDVLDGRTSEEALLTLVDDLTCSASSGSWTRRDPRPGRPSPPAVGRAST
jgi:Ca2+-transporting ATPase